MAKKTVLFADIGGVLLTNGWDRRGRKEALRLFGLDAADFDRRHLQFYNRHETGEISLDEYLEEVIFWQQRSFTREQFKSFMYQQSQPHPEILALMMDLKKRLHCRIVLISNEGRDLAEYRIKTFELGRFTDDFFISCFIHLQKPDPKFYQLALDVTQVPLADIFYLDDRKFLVEAAEKLGIEGMVHHTFEETKKALEALYG